MKDQLEQESEKFMIDIQQAACSKTPQIKKKTIGNNYPKEIGDSVKTKKNASKE